MAPSLGFRKLRCFYCGQRSPLNQDGSIREWKCANCEAVNYLDENGEITDPPVAIFDETPNSVQYAQPLHPLESISSSNPDSDLFCEDCLKNQHLVRSSLAQYFPEDDDDARPIDRNYYKFKESLEKRYPQVCEDCFQGVLERMKQTCYTAKTDHLRRLLDKTRRSGTLGKKRKTWLDVLQSLGHVLWILGISVQLACNMMGIAEYFRQHVTDLWTSSPPSLESPTLLHLKGVGAMLSSLFFGIQDVLNSLQNQGISIPSTDYCGLSITSLAKYGLVLSLMTLWWNPKFKEGYRGYHRHIKGFSDWYKYQALLLIVRVLFWLAMGYGVFSRTEAPSTLGAHMFMLAFTSFVVIAARKSIKIDFGPIFAPTSPERLLQYVRRKDKSKYSGHDMSQALTSIQEEFSAARPTSSTGDNYPFYGNDTLRKSFQNRPTSRHDLPPRNGPSGTASIRDSGSPRDPRDILGIPRTVPSLTEMTQEESFHYLSTGEIPARMQGEVDGNGAPEDMEWMPEASKHPAFQPTRAPRQSQIFGQAPVDSDPSPFWYKGLPPAPISQAHRLRNPPNAPRLQPPSQEAKENFFNRITGRESAYSGSETSTEMIKTVEPIIKPHRHEMEFAQQKFFPPSTSDVVSGLSDMFEQAFTLKSSEAERHEDSRRASSSVSAHKTRHVLTAMVLLAAWLGWNYSFTHPGLDTMKVPLGVMCICGVIALRSITEFILSSWSEKNPVIINALGATFAAMQTVAAGYAISEILAGRGDCDTCQSQGAIFVGMMLVQEVCLAAFS